MPNTKLHVAVLGGGPCGLYAARTLSSHNIQVTVIDKGIRPGGLATGHFYGENWYDMGVHMLHAHDAEIFQDMKGIMGEERIEVELNANIKWAGRTFRYPLQFVDLFKCIPFFKLSHQVINLFLAQFKHYLKPLPPKNAEDALIQLYGKPLYEYFFEDFTHKYWDIHPRDLSATFISTKMPKLTAVDVLKKGLEKIGIKDRNKSTDSALTKETLHYSRSGAETMPRRLAAAIKESGGNVIQNATANSIILENNRVTSVGYQHDGEMKYVDCDACISALPLSTLINSMQPHCPENVLIAANQLRYKPIVIYGLLVKKPKCLNSLYIYYRNRIFHRIGEPKNAGLAVNPNDHTVLIVEMTCEINDEKWRGDESVKQRMYQDLIEEGVCQPDEIVEMHMSHSESGYPIFNLGFEAHLKTVTDYVSTISNLQSTGRQGAFTYPNMHAAMRMGRTAAEKIIKEYL